MKNSLITNNCIDYNTEEEIIKKICELMDVNYSHYDNHDMGLKYFPYRKLKFIPKIVVYGSQYGAWEFSILEDMTVITPMSPFNRTFLEIIKDQESKNIDIDTSKKEDVKTIKIEMENIIKSEKFLKENKYSTIINDKNKKINWV